MKERFNIFYWGVISIILFLVFGFRAGSFINAFYFISFLVPLALLTSWVFNSYLIPNFLLKKKYARFILYTIFTLIISLDVIMVIVFIAFILITKYQPDQLHNLLVDFRLFPVIVYLTVIANAFINIVFDYLEMVEDLKTQVANKNMHENEMLIVRSERQNRKIPVDSIVFVESMSDYIIIRTRDNQKIMTRERISRIEKKLPSQFMRIHRSFIVNLNSVISFTHENVMVQDLYLPISRTYKKNVLEVLGESKAYLSDDDYPEN